MAAKGCWQFFRHWPCLPRFLGGLCESHTLRTMVAPLLLTWNEDTDAFPLVLNPFLRPKEVASFILVLL